MWGPMLEDDCDSFFMCSSSNVTLNNVCPDGTKFSDINGKSCVPVDEGYTGCFFAFDADEAGCYNDPDSNSVRAAP